MIRHVKFAELPVADQQRALAFYTRKLGLRLAQDRAYRDEWRWITLEIPGADTELLFTPRSERGSREGPSLALVVDDVQDAYRRLSRVGVEFSREPSEAPWAPGEMFALLEDSEGNTVLLSSPRDRQRKKASTRG